MLKKLGDSKKIDIGLESDNDFDMPDVQSYLYTIEIIRMHWKQTDIIDSLKVFVLLHL